MKKIFYLLICIPFLLATTCENDDEEVNCTLEAVAGISVTVKNAVTSETLSVGVTVLLQDDLYSETIQEFIGEDFSVFSGAWERTGTYIVTVSKEGYQTFVSEPVTVNQDVCHVIPVQMAVLLQPN
uniref:hypothetical protein n=1 Tax=Flavobacterium sp. TaxID=239 RepID=UPI00404B14F5